MPRPALQKRRSQQPLAEPRSKRGDLRAPLRGAFIFRRDWCPRVGLGREADMTWGAKNAQSRGRSISRQVADTPSFAPLFAAALCQAIKAFPAVLALTLN